MRRPRPNPSRPPQKAEATSGKEPEVFSPEALTSKNRQMEIFLLVFSIALYINTLWFGYALDDALMITQNSYTKQGIQGIPAIMTHDAFTGFFGEQKQLVAGGRYRPLSQVIFAIEFQVSGLNPLLGHLVNILVYALISVLLFRILRRLLPTHHHLTWSQSLPFLATALYVAHPMHTEVVANIKGLDELLSLGFSLLALHFSLTYLDNKKSLHLAATGLFFLLALLSKENAITFMPVIFLCLYFFRQPRRQDYLISLLPFLVSFPIYLALRFHALGYLTSQVKVNEILNDPYLNATAAQEWATNIFTWGKYIVLLVFPHPLTHDYYPWQISLKSWSEAGPIIALLFYIALIVVAISGFLKKKLWAFAILFFLISFSISSNVVFNIGTLMNERFMFIPSLGFTILLAMVLSNQFRKDKKSLAPSKGMIIATVLLLSLYSAKTFTRNFAWKNDYTLFTTDVKTSKNSTKCNVSAGGVILEKAREAKTDEVKQPLLQQAENYLRRAIDIYPENFAGWVLLGNVYLEKKDYVTAKDCYIRCLNINRTLPEGLSKLAFVGYKLENQDNHAGSLEAFQVLSKLQPGNKKHMIQVVDGYSKTGRADTALVILNRLLMADSNFADAWSKLGEIYGRIYNNIVLADRFLNKAYALDSSNITTLENLGIVKGINKEFPQSMILLKRALALDTVNPRIMNNIASTYYMMGNTQEAENWTKKAAEANQTLEKNK